MIYPFTYQMEADGAHVATMFGTARIGHLHGTSTWAITGIVLDTQSGIKASVELTEPWLYSRIALWLLTEHRRDIEAEWRDYTAGRTPAEAVAS